MRQALKENAFGGEIEHYSDGVQLLNKLLKCKAENAHPQMIILDLNMPLKSGIEVLKEINRDPDYQKIPFAVVTASLRKEDEEACDIFGCEMYLRKPVRFNEYSQIGSAIVSKLRANSLIADCRSTVLQLAELAFFIFSRKNPESIQHIHGFWEKLTCFYSYL